MCRFSSDAEEGIASSLFSFSGTSQMDLNSAVRWLAPGATWKDEKTSSFRCDHNFMGPERNFSNREREEPAMGFEAYESKRSAPTFDYINRRKNVSTQKAM